MCAPPRFREEDGAFAAVCSWELTVPGMLPNLQLMDEPLSEPENLSDKQSGALSGAACGDNEERGGRAGKGNIRGSGEMSLCGMRGSPQNFAGKREQEAGIAGLR